MLTSADGNPIFRIALPLASPPSTQEDTRLSMELAPYISGWSILIAQPAAGASGLLDRLQELGAHVHRAQDIVAVLAHVENGSNLDLLVIDEQLLRQETRGLLRAILKLCPGSGVVVLCDEIPREAADLSGELVFAPHQAPPDKVLLSMVEAKSLAASRHRK